jgi:hypothetical protein
VNAAPRREWLSLRHLCHLGIAATCLTKGSLHVRIEGTNKRIEVALIAQFSARSRGNAQAANLMLVKLQKPSTLPLPNSHSGKQLLMAAITLP